MNQQRRNLLSLAIGFLIGLIPGILFVRSRARGAEPPLLPPLKPLRNSDRISYAKVEGRTQYTLRVMWADDPGRPCYLTFTDRNDVWWFVCLPQNIGRMTEQEHRSWIHWFEYLYNTHATFRSYINSETKLLEHYQRNRRLHEYA